MTIPILEILVKASLIVAVGAVVNVWVLRRASAAWRHMVWAMVVAGLVALPVLSATLPRWGLPIAQAGSMTARPEPQPPLVREYTDVVDVVAESTPAAAPASAAPREAPGASVPWAVVLPVLYLAGVLILLARLLAGQWMVRTLARNATTVTDSAWTTLLAACERRMGVERPVRLLRSVEGTMPMAFGLFRPAIVIPSSADLWPDDRRSAVLLHELAHIARRDCLTQLLAALTCAAYWVHPGAWWVARRLRVERELACDDRVLAIGTPARDYAGHLLEIAYTFGGSRTSAMTVSMARRQHVEGRMLAVLDAARSRAIPALRGLVASCTIAAAMLVPLAAMTAVTALPAVTSAPAMAPVPPATPATAGPMEQQEYERITRPLVRLATKVLGQAVLPGTWEIRPSRTAGHVHLNLKERVNSNHGFTLAVSELTGLSPALLSGGNGPATFSLRREAGTINFEGVFRSGVGAGTFTFTANPAFAGELAKRGFARPTEDEQYRLAKSDIGTAYLDQLDDLGYAKPTLQQLIRAGDHGVDRDFVRGMAQAGHRLGQIEGLIRMRDHGVDPDYIREMTALGLKGLSADELVRARDHGVDPEYVGDMKDLGYASLPLEDLINARDHGVDPGYVSALRTLGYKLTLTELRNGRDHGVDPEFVRDMAAAGYKGLSMTELIRLRDHGVTPSWVKRQNDRERSRLSIDELVRRRDRGGDPTP